MRTESKLARTLRNTSSALANASAFYAADAERKAAGPQIGVSHKTGKKRTPYRHYIVYDQRTVHRQIGIAWRYGECIPRIQVDVEHWFLHATKGWRMFHHIPFAMKDAMRRLVLQSAMAGATA